MTALLSDHHPIGASTGYLEDLRDDWPALISEALRVSSFAVELATGTEEELESLMAFLLERGAEGSLPFRYLSIHAPFKKSSSSDEQLVAQLAAVSADANAVLVHPDIIEEPDPYQRVLGRKLVLENMDGRKATGRTVDELRPLFAELPEAGFCFDIAHAQSLDPSMALGNDLLDAFGQRLRHVHLSSLTDDLEHVPLTREHAEVFQPLLRRCADVPWILEAPPPDW